MLKPPFVLPLLNRFIGSAETESTGWPLGKAWKLTHERAHLPRARQLDRRTKPTRHALLDLSSRQALIVSELGQYLGNAALKSIIWLHLCNYFGQRCERVQPPQRDDHPRTRPANGATSGWGVGGKRTIARWRARVRAT